MPTYYSARHQPSAEELGLPPGQEFVFAGFFLAWLTERGLLDPILAQDMALNVALVRQRRMTGGEFLARIDGIVDATVVDEEAQEFASRYFDMMNGGEYLANYQHIFSVGGQCAELFSVEDTWDNYDRIAPLIAVAYARE